MFNKNRRIEARDMTVAELRAILEDLPDNCEVNFMGDNYGYIHIESDLSIISFDDASLEDEYEEE